MVDLFQDFIWLWSSLRLAFTFILGKPVGRTILYFGCRNKAVDYLYEEELSNYEKSGLLEVSCKISFIIFFSILLLEECS